MTRDICDTCRDKKWELSDTKYWSQSQMSQTLIKFTEFQGDWGANTLMKY